MMSKFPELAIIIVVGLLIFATSKIADLSIKRKNAAKEDKKKP